MNANGKKTHSFLRHLTVTGLMGVSLFLQTSTAIAAPSSVVPPQADFQPTNPETPLTGLDALKAQMNAMQGGLENLRRLRQFFDSANFNETAVLERAQRLIKTLPQNENAGDAAWRIAAVASLTLSSGALADISIDDEYRLTKGAIGWDLGPEGARTHTGFVPVSPKSLDGAVKAVSGPTALSDGIAAIEGFEASVPNGLYRIVIVRDRSGDDASPSDNPFGAEIDVNGAPLIGQHGSRRDDVTLTAGGEKVASAAVTETRRASSGLAIEGWAIVEDGRLNVGFNGLSQDHAITAIIAEPFDIEKLELSPSVMDTLAESLGDIGTAAGPEAESEPQGPRFGRVFSRNQTAPTNAASAPSESTRDGGGGKNSGGTTSGPERFATAKSRLAAPPQTPNEDNEENEEEAADSIATTSDAPPFEARQLLIKRSSGDDPDTPGLAVDLGTLLDDASLSGIFICLSNPCESVADYAVEPDLAAAAALLGDWLGDPADLSESWIELETVLAGRDLGAEIAMVYEFEIGSDSWTDVELRASAGSGLFLWLDGGFIFGAGDDNGFVDNLDFEYIVNLPDLPGGKHYLQVLSESHLPQEGFALELRGTPVNATTSVSEPGMLALFVAALYGMYTTRRRNKKISNQ